MLHGLSSGIISYFRGGSFRAGFFSGLGSAFDVGTTGYGNMVGRTSIMAIIGGTFAKLGGGKFANGAMSAAFTHLFNGEAIKFIKAKLPTTEELRKRRALYIMKRFKIAYGTQISYKQAYALTLPRTYPTLKRYGQMVLVGVGAFAIGLVAPEVYAYAMANPETVVAGIEILDGYYGGSSPGNNIGSFTNGFEYKTGIQVVPNGLKP